MVLALSARMRQLRGGRTGRTGYTCCRTHSRPAANLSLGALDTLCLDGVALVSGLVKARIGAGLVIMALGFVVTASADLARELVRVALRGD